MDLETTLITARCAMVSKSEGGTEREIDRDRKKGQQQKNNSNTYACFIPFISAIYCQREANNKKERKQSWTV